MTTHYTTTLLSKDKAAALYKTAPKTRTKNQERARMNNISKQATAQFNADANLLAEFEQSQKVSGKSFHYTESVKSAPARVPEEQVNAYLSKIQRGGLVQSFGCLLAIEDPSFRILVYSQNLFDLFGLNTKSVHADCLLGVDSKRLFTRSSSEALLEAVVSDDLWLSNPIWVVAEKTQRPFLAILHRVDVGVVIDLEPAKENDPAFSVDGAVRSQKLALQTISRLHSLPRGDIDALCDALLKDVKELTGYDRVMVYKFHEDEHGEVVAENKRPGLEPYLGLHYPATDIPQATRFLFMKNRVRMIVDAAATPVRIIQSGELEQPLTLVNSTLRATHGCHAQYLANMGTRATLVMTIFVNQNGSMKLWGLVSCHHHLEPRYVPFPIRYACQFIMQAFGSQLSMEIQLELYTAERKILKTQALLCEMVLADAPFGIVTKSPNVMDLVNCNGAAFYYAGVCRVLGVTPTAEEIKDITEWVFANGSDLTVWSTDSLIDAGYPNAPALGDVVCGLAVARITSNDFLFWFRAQTEKEIKWGGKHPGHSKVDDNMMHPESSFKAFLEVVKNKSFPWEECEINAIQALQHTMACSGALQKIGNDSAKMTIEEKNELEKDTVTLATTEMVRILHTAIAPVLAVDCNGKINTWNLKIAELTGLPFSEAMGKSLVDELVHEKSRVDLEHHLSRALQGKQDENIELQLRNLGQGGTGDSVFILANACSCRDYTNKVVSVCFVGQDVTEAKNVLAKFTRLQEDYITITQTLNPMIPPIFVSDENARCSEWNGAMEKLTGWEKCEVIGKMLPGEIFGEYCRLASPDDVTKLMILLYQTLCRQNNEKFPFAFFAKEGMYVEAILTTNKRVNTNGNIVGCVCILQTVFPNTKQVSDRISCFPRLQDMEYIRQEIRRPLDGIQFTHKLFKSTNILNDQKLLLETSDACQRQIKAILQGTNLRSIEDGSLELNMDGFLLETVIDAVVSQVKTMLLEKNMHLIQKVSEETRALTLYGDQARLQQVLSNFLQHIINHASTAVGGLEVEIDASSKLMQDGHEHVQLQFRMTHPGEGLPMELLEDMFQEEAHWASQEGFGLSLSRKLLRKMNGDVQYIRETTNCYFLVDIALQTSATI